MRLRQEVVNVVLAEALQDRGLAAVPEGISRSVHSGQRAMPDVIVDYRGLRLAIESEFASTQGAEARATSKALERVHQGLCHIGVAVVYPEHLAVTAFDILKEKLKQADLRFRVMTELADIQPTLDCDEVVELPSLMTGRLGDLVEQLRRSYEQLMADEAVEKAVAVLEKGIQTFVMALQGQQATTERFAHIIGALNETSELKPRQRTAVNKVCALILINALIFQEMLAKYEQRVAPLQSARTESDKISWLADIWRYILDEINYYPIFHLAHELIICLAADAHTNKAISALIDDALRIVTWQGALRHDLMGRVYHRLLEEAKYLGAYYTSIPAAALLLKLALTPDRWQQDWSQVETYNNFRVADLACGTGTLLVAAAETLLDNHVRGAVAAGLDPDVENLQKSVVEHSIWGYDVLASALHLTASILALRMPAIPVNTTHLWCMPLGGELGHLGSLDLIYEEYVEVTASLFSVEERILPDTSGNRAAIPALDLCVMNPPFTRSVGGNLLFGNLPDTRRKAMQQRLRNIVKQKQVPASITAGLGSVFVALGGSRVVEGGRLALVLPRAVLSGVAWGKTREYLAEEYAIEYLIVSDEPKRWNFSENTNLSEALIVARKCSEADRRQNQVVCINLWRNMRRSVEALAMAAQLRDEQPPDLLTGQGALDLMLGEQKVGEAVSIPQSTLANHLWHFACAFSQTELKRTFFTLLEGQLYLPGHGTVAKIPLAALGTLATLGPDARDVADGFDLSKATTPYPALWGHDATEIISMYQHSNAHLQPLSKPKAGRPLRKTAALWPKAADLLIAERLWLETTRVFALVTPLSVLSNMWWPVTLAERSENARKAMALWLNSTLGFTLALGHRVETRGPWIKFKKPTLMGMPVLDVKALDESKLEELAQAFDELAGRPLCPFPQIAQDPVRKEIDDTIARVLGLPDFGILRELLAREPVVCSDLSGLLET